MFPYSYISDPDVSIARVHWAASAKLSYLATIQTQAGSTGAWQNALMRLAAFFCELIQVYKCFEASPAHETHLWNMLLWSWYELYGCMAVVSEQCVNGQFYVITTYENTEQYIQLFHFFRTTPYFIMNLYYN